VIPPTCIDIVYEERERKREGNVVEKRTTLLPRGKTRQLRTLSTTLAHNPIEYE